MNTKLLIWVTLLILGVVFSELSAASSNSNATQIVGANTSRTLGSNIVSASEASSTWTNQSVTKDATNTTYEVSDEETGTTLILQFGSQPTAEEVEKAFSDYYRKHPEALSNKLPVLVIPNTNSPPPFPTEFTNRAGEVYRNIRVQQAYPDGIVISCVNSKNVRGLEKIDWQELPIEVQKYYGYDAKNPAAFEERQRQLQDYNKAIWDRQWEAERPKREAELRKKEQDQAAQRKFFEDTKAKASTGDLEAMVQLATCYSTGLGVTKDSAEAVKWYRKTAESGDQASQYNLGVHYWNGEGVPKDDETAAKWFLRAALQGDYHAQMIIADMYVRGEGVRQDFVEAYKWFNIASTPEKLDVPEYLQGAMREIEQDSASKARQARDNLAQRITNAQIAEGQRRAAIFKPRKEDHSGGLGQSNGDANNQPLASGTGFFISKDGYLISNAHVVKDAAQTRLVTSAGLISAKVVKVDAANDLVLLKAEGQFAPLAIVASRGVKLGGTVATVGFPNIGLQGFAPKLAKGEIASLSGAGDDARYFQISVPVQPGNSGGALVDERGNVVGVVSAKLNASAALRSSGALPENVNYAVKSSYLLSFLESVPEVAAKLKEPSVKDKKFEDMVKEAEQAAVLVLVY